MRGVGRVVVEVANFLIVRLDLLLQIAESMRPRRQFSVHALAVESQVLQLIEELGSLRGEAGGGALGIDLIVLVGKELPLLSFKVVQHGFLVPSHLEQIGLNMLGTLRLLSHNAQQFTVLVVALPALLFNLAELVSQLLEGWLKQLTLSLELENLSLDVVNEQVLRVTTHIIVAVIVFGTSLHSAEGRLNFEELLPLGLVGLLSGAVLQHLDAQLLEVGGLLALAHDVKLVHRADGELIG